MTIDMLRLVLYWIHIDGVAVWWVSSYEPLDNSLHTPCRRCCGKFVTNVYALKANLFALDRSAGFFHGGLVGGNIVWHSKEFMGCVSQPS